MRNTANTESFTYKKCSARVSCACKPILPAYLVPLSLLLAIAAASMSAQPVGFFGRAADLGENKYWVVGEFGEGPYILDMSVRRPVNGSWTRCRQGTNCPTNEGHMTFGTPVYAPADGVIRTCWRNFDDNPSPGVKDPRVPSDTNPNPQIFSGGNHVNIETTDGRVVFIGHLQKGTVPPTLCPFNAAVANPNDRTGSYPTQAIIPVAQRPNYPVRRGQFIGYAGNSGNSSAPHVHMHIKPNTGDNSDGDALPMPFAEVWAQSYNGVTAPSDSYWYKLEGTAITSSSGTTMVHPAPFLRRSTEIAGSIMAADPVFLSTGRAVTAVRTGVGNLMLIAWALPFDGTIARRGDVVEGTASLVRVVAPTPNHVVAAVKDASGHLKLILYHVSNTGMFQRLDDIVAEGVHSFDMAVTTNSEKKIVVAMRLADDRLKMRVYNLDNSTGSLRLQAAGSRTEGSISAVAVTGARNFLGAAVAVRTAEQTLKVIPYRLSADGGTIIRGADYEAGEVSGAIDITAVPRALVAAMRDSDGRLRVISLQTSPNGNISGNKEVLVWSTGQITDVKVTTTPNAANGNFVTTVRDSTGDLRLMAWTMDDNASNLRRSGSVKAGAAIGVSSAGGGMSTLSGGSPRDVVLTTMRDSDSNLRLIEWEANLNP